MHPKQNHTILVLLVYNGIIISSLVPEFTKEYQKCFKMTTFSHFCPFWVPSNQFGNMGKRSNFHMLFCIFYRNICGSNISS